MTPKPKREQCQKCGFDHNYPGSDLIAIQVLARVLTRDGKMEMITRYGKVRPPEIVHRD